MFFFARHASCVFCGCLELCCFLSEDGDGCASSWPMPRRKFVIVVRRLTLINPFDHALPYGDRDRRM